MPGSDAISQEVDTATADQKTIIHSFDGNILSSYRADEDFDYRQPPGNRQNIFSVIFHQFLNFLIRIFGNQFIAWLVLITLIIVGLVGLGFALYGLFGIGKTLPVYSEEASKLPYSVYEEDIGSTDFPGEIETAVAQANYRKAIRLLYLYSLRILSDKKYIEWQPSKTNYDYVNELRNEVSRNQFQGILYYFEYVWYGDFHAEKNHYDSMTKVFFELKKNLV